MKILVTGGRGQLGRSLQKVAADYPDHQFIFTDMPEVDITNRESVKQVVAECGAQAIVNCAAYTAVDRAEQDEIAADRINRQGAQVLALTARECNLKLVHISTDYVFDGRALQPYTERSIVNPISVYGVTKYAGEQAVATAGADAVVIRTQWLYSEFGSNFVKTMLRLGRERGSVGVVADQVGSPTYATDLARCAVALLDRHFEGYDIYNFSNSGVVSWYDFAKAIFELADMNVEVTPLATSQFKAVAHRPAYSVLDKSKVESAGVEVRGWREPLGECIELLKQNQEI